ncbi:variable surface lipoprotein [Mesomycoplasma hyorhinis]|uniref:variable surface lipoprotein n=1 Tax=Mesomycoplasma hyorhinis TaxID=2100 RepID=UPI001C03A57D|nr:variable surface lipoprotein [Mesomycoplasma hyorhinis]
MKKSIFSKKLLFSFGSLVALAAIPLITISCGQTNTDQSQQPGSGSGSGSGTSNGSGSTPTPEQGNNQGGSTPTPEQGNNQGGSTPTPEQENNQGGSTPTPEQGNNQGGSTPTPEQGNNQGGSTPTPEQGNNQGGSTPTQGESTTTEGSTTNNKPKIKTIKEQADELKTALTEENKKITDTVLPIVKTIQPTQTAGQIQLNRLMDVYSGIEKHQKENEKLIQRLEKDLTKDHFREVKYSLAEMSKTIAKQFQDLLSLYKEGIIEKTPDFEFQKDELFKVAQDYIAKETKETSMMKETSMKNNTSMK